MEEGSEGIHGKRKKTSCKRKIFAKRKYDGFSFYPAGNDTVTGVLDHTDHLVRRA